MYMSQIFFKKENQRAAVVAQVAKQWTIKLWDKDSNPACFQIRLFSKICRCLKFLALSTGSRQTLSFRFSVKLFLRDLLCWNLDFDQHDLGPGKILTSFYLKMKEGQYWSFFTFFLLFDLALKCILFQTQPIKKIFFQPKKASIFFQRPFFSFILSSSARWTFKGRQGFEVLSTVMRPGEPKARNTFKGLARNPKRT